MKELAAGSTSTSSCMNNAHGCAHTSLYFGKKASLCGDPKLLHQCRWCTNPLRRVHDCTSHLKHCYTQLAICYIRPVRWLPRALSALHGPTQSKGRSRVTNLPAMIIPNHKYPFRAFVAWASRATFLAQCTVHLRSRLIPAKASTLTLPRTVVYLDNPPVVVLCT